MDGDPSWNRIKAVWKGFLKYEENGVARLGDISRQIDMTEAEAIDCLNVFIREGMIESFGEEVYGLTSKGLLVANKPEWKVTKPLPIQFTR